jgi:hypothetical protein
LIDRSTNCDHLPEESLRRLLHVAPTHAAARFGAPSADVTFTFTKWQQVNSRLFVSAVIFKSRWDIEKVFDEFKNKLGEIKSWASTPNAKTCQARLLCLTHNLLTLMEERIFREQGVRNEAETKRKSKTLLKRDRDSKAQGRGGLTVLQKAIQRLTQRTVKLIRWLKNHFDTRRTWHKALARLAKIYATS